MPADRFGIDVPELYRNQNALALGQQQQQMNALALRKGQREEQAQNALALAGPDLISSDPARRAAGEARLAPIAPEKVFEWRKQATEAQQAKLKFDSDISGRTATGLLAVPDEQLVPASAAAAAQLKSKGVDTARLEQTIATGDPARIRQHWKIVQADALTVEQSMAQQNSARDDQRADANSPFKSTGEANRDYQDYEIKKAGASASARANAFGSGRTITERMNNTLINGDPGSPDYAAAYAYLAKPRVVFDPNTGESISISPDMSWARKPGTAGGSSSQPWHIPMANPTGQSSPTTGQPTITAAPGRSASAARATFEANVSQADKDIAVAERMFFPSGQFDRGIAMTGAGNIPLTQGREARQAVSRAVEIILRLRTGAAAPDTEVMRYTDMYAPSTLDNDSGARTKMQRLKEFFEDSKRVAASRLPGSASAGGAGGPTTGQPVRINSDADYAQLPPGTRYIAPDGSTRTKR